VDSKLIQKFYRGECTPEEFAAVLEWFEKEKLNSSQEQAINRFWQEAENEKRNKEFAQDAAGILNNINKVIDGQQDGLGCPLSITEEENVHTLKTDQRTWLLKAVAAVVLPICFLWLFTNYFSNTNKQKIVSRLITKEAVLGTRETISLEDGSKIILNAGSKISYQEPFSTYKREITLSGEAFFEVAKDSLRPFIVRTSNITTQALGTSFNIKYHSKENNISVALATGSVKIKEEAKEGSNQIARLEPGQQLVYERVDHTYQVEAYDSNEVLAWREGILYFKKAKLSQVIEKLKSWYGVEIEIKGKVSSNDKEKLYTGVYDNQSLDDVLEGISFVKDFTYTKNGNKLILKFN